MINLWRVTLSIAVLVGFTACGVQTSNDFEPVGTLEVVSDETTETGVLPLSLVEVARLEQPVDAASRLGDPAVYFVARGGTVHRFVDSVLESEPVLDISDLTEGQVVGWVLAALGDEQVETICEGLSSQLDTQETPVDTSGIPW